MEAWPAPRRPVRDLRPGDHAWLGYRSAAEHQHVTGAFIRDGVRAGRLVICVQEPGFQVPATLDAADCPAGGLLRILNADQASRTNGRFDPDLLGTRLSREIRRGVRAGLAPIRVTLDLTAVLREP